MKHKCLQLQTLVKFCKTKGLLILCEHGRRIDDLAMNTIIDYSTGNVNEDVLETMVL